MFQCSKQKIRYISTKSFGNSDLENLNLPFDLAQGGESFDLAQDREPVERLVQPFGIWCLRFGISSRLLAELLAAGVAEATFIPFSFF
jgi:hypothetical protein